jgi:hypothetical protein
MARNRIYVSWNEEWDLLTYVQQYLKERGLRDDAAARLKVRECIDRYTAPGPLKKADVDFYLDRNIKAQLPLEALKK